MTISRDAIEKRLAYREAFGTRSGKAVLADLLVELDFFAREPDPASIAIAHKILSNLGIYHGHNIDRVTDALMDAANDEDIRAIEIEEEELRAGSE